LGLKFEEFLGQKCLSSSLEDWFPISVLKCSDLYNYGSKAGVYMKSGIADIYQFDVG
jgi:hypothetical protein